MRWIFDCIGGGDIGAEAVRQEDHFGQVHGASPVLNRLDELREGHYGVGAEFGACAPTEAEQIEGVERSRPLTTTGARQRLHVGQPDGHAGRKAVQEHERRALLILLLRDAQRPDVHGLVADADVAATNALSRRTKASF